MAPYRRRRPLIGRILHPLFTRLLTSSGPRKIFSTADEPLNRDQSAHRSIFASGRVGDCVRLWQATKEIDVHQILSPPAGIDEATLSAVYKHLVRRTDGPRALANVQFDVDLPGVRDRLRRTGRRLTASLPQRSASPSASNQRSSKTSTAVR